MKIKSYFHTNYTSSGNGIIYTKVSVELEGRGVFCVIVNNTDGNTQHQRYVFTKEKPRNPLNFIGKTREGLYEDEAIGKAWDTIDHTLQGRIERCVNQLPYAFTKYRGIDYGMSMDDVTQVRDYIKELKSYFGGGCVSFDEVAKLSSVVHEETTVATESTVTDTTETAATESTESTVTESTEIVEDETVAESVTEKSVSEVISATRSRKKMAYFIDNQGFTEFVNGCYYDIVSSFRDNGVDYHTIVNDKGESRTVNDSRIKVVEVYAEPPVR